MGEMLREFLKDKNVFGIIFNLIRICLSALGVVYLFGRMLDITKTYKQKNLAAILAVFLNSFLILYCEGKASSAMVKYLWYSYLYTTCAIVPYVWFLWRSFDRVDSALDKKGFKDKGFKKGK